jgi:retron-type reverse transcriptase
MARELKGASKEQEANWLTQGIESLINGSYTPRFLKRWYFKDEVVDQLYLADRVLQNLLLQELKPTFPHVMNKNCYHLEGPGGVKSATDVILQAFKEQKPQYIIRADIRSFYKSISHKLLIEEVNRHYQDPKVQEMLKNIIVNPIETPNGCMNPDYGIALRGPLSQFFSGLFLKRLDDSFNDMNVTDIRYNDDLLILCKSFRQLNRSKQRMMKILAERRLKLSRKKTRIGYINRGFHFLGIHYPGTQPQDKATVTQKASDTVSPAIPNNAYYLALLMGGRVHSESI